MASVVTFSNGLRRIEFSLTPNGPRRAVRLGRISAKVAAAWQAKLEAIVADKAVHRPHDPEITAWLAGLDEAWLARLRAVGLADGVGLSQTTLGAFLERCFATLTSKPATRTFYGHTRRNLEEHFGAGRVLRDISAADADGWRAWLVNHEKLSPATVARRVIAARTLWRKAVRWKLAAVIRLDWMTELYHRMALPGPSLAPDGYQLFRRGGGQRGRVGFPRYLVGGAREAGHE